MLYLLGQAAESAEKHEQVTNEGMSSKPVDDSKPHETTKHTRKGTKLLKIEGWMYNCIEIVTTVRRKTESSRHLRLTAHLPSPSSDASIWPLPLPFGWPLGDGST